MSMETTTTDLPQSDGKSACELEFEKYYADDWWSEDVVSCDLVNNRNTKYTSHPVVLLSALMGDKRFSHLDFSHLAKIVGYALAEWKAQNTGTYWDDMARWSDGWLAFGQTAVCHRDCERDSPDDYCDSCSQRTFENAFHFKHDFYSGWLYPIPLADAHSFFERISRTYGWSCLVCGRVHKCKGPLRYNLYDDAWNFIVNRCSRAESKCGGQWHYALREYDAMCGECRAEFERFRSAGRKKYQKLRIGAQRMLDAVRRESEAVEEARRGKPGINRIREERRQAKAAAYEGIRAVSHIEVLDWLNHKLGRQAVAALTKGAAK